MSRTSESALNQANAGVVEPSIAGPQREEVTHGFGNCTPCTTRNPASRLDPVRPRDTRNVSLGRDGRPHPRMMGSGAESSLSWVALCACGDDRKPAMIDAP